MADRLKLQAPAKVNLGLSVLGKRADGYHDILSVFQAVSWYDEVTVELAGRDIELTCSDPGLPNGPRNLIWRAADVARQRFGVDAGVSIHLDKRIPVGAGLGGGSSDAAAVLRALKTLWGDEHDVGEWLEICSTIGSDVPFFWRCGTAVVEGRGERVRPLGARENLAMVVAFPAVHVNTAWAYDLLRAPYGESSEYRSRVRALADGAMGLAEFCGRLDNTFQAPVEHEHPEVGRLRLCLIEAGATTALMSGSGSSVFGIFPDRPSALDALGRLSADVSAREVACVGPT